MRFGENNVLGPKYIDVLYQFQGLVGGEEVYGSPKFFVYYSQKWKKY